MPNYRIIHKPTNALTQYIVIAKNDLTSTSSAFMYWTGSKFSLAPRDAKVFTHAQASKQLYHKKISALKSQGLITSVRMEEARNE